MHSLPKSEHSYKTESSFFEEWNIPWHEHAQKHVFPGHRFAKLPDCYFTSPLANKIILLNDMKNDILSYRVNDKFTIESKCESVLTGDLPGVLSGLWHFYTSTHFILNDQENWT